jgi:hypothetical protein
MPVMLARAIADISFQNVPNYAPPDKHGGSPDIGVDLAE